MGPLAEEAIELQKKDEKVNFVPNRFENTYYAGWKIFMIGVFHVNYGGVTKSQLGITMKQVKFM